MTSFLRFFLATSILLPATASFGDELLPADRAIYEVIDHYITLKLKQDGIPPVKPADDANLVRRLTLDLAGRIPSTAEARAYVESSDANKRNTLIERLLASPDYAFHHRNELDALLLAGNGSHDEWRAYLRTAADENRPWDQMFREMMLGREQDPAQKTALTFLKTRAKNVDDMTNDTSRIFFGVSIHCAKCHDHPLVDEWKQDHFFGFSLFFSRTYLTKKNTVAEKYNGTVKFKTTAGEEKQARFMFLTGALVEEPQIEKSKEQRQQEDEEVKRQLKDDKAPPPKPPEFSPRTKFVELALNESDTPFFARSIVNRIWVRLLGCGLVNPLDQMHSGNEPSHPQLLEWLARDLISHRYDLKRLIGGIVLSDTYARSSRWNGDNDPPEPNTFAVAVARPLSPQQYSLSLHVATRNPQTFARDVKPEDWRKRREALESAATGFSGLIERPTEQFQVSVDEALLFTNNERIEKEFLKPSDEKLVGYLKKIDDRSSMIEAAFWAIYSRPPTEEEQAACADYLASRQDQLESGIQQIVWVLITSPEMRVNY